MRYFWNDKAPINFSANTFPSFHRKTQLFDMSFNEDLFFPFHTDTGSIKVKEKTLCIVMAVKTMTNTQLSTRRKKG